VESREQCLKFERGEDLGIVGW